MSSTYRSGMGRGRRSGRRKGLSPVAMLALVDGGGEAGDEVIAGSLLLNSQSVKAELAGERVTVIERARGGLRWGVRFGGREFRGTPRFTSDLGSTVCVRFETTTLAESEIGFELIEVGVLCLRALDGGDAIANLYGDLWDVGGSAARELVISARWADN